jgi:hypothetical protein
MNGCTDDLRTGTRICRRETTGSASLTEACGVPVSRADIVACYRLILGGQPEDETAIAWHRRIAQICPNCGTHSVRAVFGDSRPAPALISGYRAACAAAGDRDRDQWTIPLHGGASSRSSYLI